MADSTGATFVQALQKLPLLPADQKNQLAALQQQFPDLKAFTQELVRRNWLTAFQVKQIAAGKADALIPDQYVILDLLGQGGMGAVYKAKQTRMDRLVAVKVIRKEAVGSSGSLERFQREARIAAQLSHPNVVTVFDSNTAHGTPFLVMEFIEGTDLAKLVEKSGPLPVGQACEYIRQAALGLQHAHERGLVHRDIKPHNLMLTCPQSAGARSPDRAPSSPLAGEGSRVGTVKVMDLGLARTAYTAEATAASKGLTQTGAMMGTADYLAPEQAQDARRVDIRADIYSLGCSLYHLLAGQPPFAGGTLANKIAAHMFTEPPAITLVRPDVPPALEAVLRRMLAKKPQERFQTPAEVAEALAPFTEKGHQGPVALPLAVPVAQAYQTRVGSPAVVTVEQQRQVRKALASASETNAAPGTVPPLVPRRRRRKSNWVRLGALVCLALVAVSGLAALATAPLWLPFTIFRPALAKSITNSIGMKLVLIPAGKFMMGSPAGESDRGGGETQHEVEITKPFSMGVFEVTQEEYEKVMGMNPSKGEGNPVENVSWYDAVEFCRKLSERAEEKKAGRTYRLPTEAEWEYACRARTTSVFHYGDSLSSEQANFQGGYPYGGAAKGKYLAKTATVGSYQANAFGLYDMHGNVWEWCNDWYDKDYYSKSPKQDPQGPESSSEGRRVLRGSSWANYGRYCRSANRDGGTPGLRNSIIGFRVVCVAPRTP